MSHTPGPWEMRKDGVILALSRTERQAIGQFFGLASEQTHLDEHRFNNLLIAAAPEMLTELKRVEQGLRSLVEMGLVRPEVADRVTKVIAKAEGH